MPATKTAPPRDFAALGLAFGPAAAQGFSRFGYALLVPGVRADLGWSFAQAGGAMSANAAGYLAGALIVSRMASRFGLRQVFAVGLVSVIFSLFWSAFASTYEIVLLIRFLSGIAGAISFVAGGAIAARLVAVPGRASPLSVYFAGGGIGIALSGLLVPWLVGEAGLDWRRGWIGLGVLAVFCSVIAWSASDVQNRPLEHREAQSRRLTRLTAIHVAYGLFGAGYIAYMTFVIALLRDRGFENSFRSFFWVVLGLSAAISSPIWGRLPVRLRGRREFALVNATTALGVLIVIPFHSAWAAVLSAIIFGGSFLAVVGAVTSLARSLVPSTRWTHVIGTLTGAFALGQCTGPIVSGLLSDRPGGVETGLWLSLALLLGAAAVALLQSDASKFEG